MLDAPYNTSVLAHQANGDGIRHGLRLHETQQAPGNEAVSSTARVHNLRWHRLRQQKH